MQNIENVLRNFTFKIPILRHLNYWERLRELKMNSIQRRLERYRIIYTWKIVEGLVPNCGLKYQESETKGRKCIVPKSTCRVQSIKTIRESTFQVTGPKLFNELPRELRDMTKCGVEEFKFRLDGFLTRIPDQPRCPEMTPVAMTPDSIHTNSLVYQVAWARREGLLKDC